MATDEFLLLEGDLGRDGVFKLHRAQTAPAARNWSNPPHSPVSLELMGADGVVLHREAASQEEHFGCSAQALVPWRIRAAIKLREDAVGVRLMRDCIALWSRELPERGQLAIERVGTQFSKTRQATVRLRFSTPGDNAWLAVVYQWGVHKHRVLYLGEPRQTVTLDLSRMPGGPTCRVLASYSNGLRSATAASEPFKVPLVGPSVAIVQPEAGVRHPYGVPLVLQASVLDEERAGGADFSDLVWLVDGRELARGLMACTDVLSEGPHDIAVEYRGHVAARATMRISMNRVGDEHIAAEWPDWDPVVGRTVQR